MKEALNEIVAALFAGIVQEIEDMPSNVTPEDLLTRKAEFANKLIGTVKALTKISESLPHDVPVVGFSNGLLTCKASNIPERSIIQGVQRQSFTHRMAIFNENSSSLPSPSKNSDLDSNMRVLHEMVFMDTDCFIELSYLKPGKHGWVIIFRVELRNWLLSAVEPFHLIHEDKRGGRTYYGVYIARLLPRASMNGAEIACLSNPCRQIVITAVSGSDQGSDLYNDTEENLLMSLKTLPCLLLQCMEFPPSMRHNSLTHTAIDKLTEPRLASPRPPGVSSPVVHKARQVPSILPDDSRRLPNMHPACASHLTHMPHMMDYRSMPQNGHSEVRVQFPGPASIFCSSINENIHSIGYPAMPTKATRHKDQWYNVGGPDNTPRGAPFVHQTWQKDHQNNNEANFEGIVTQMPRLGPQPLEPTMHNNTQQRNSQMTGLANPHKRLSLPKQAATYWPPHTRGYQVQNQNIPFRNSSTARNPHIASTGGQISHGVLPLPLVVPPTHTGLAQQRTAAPRFYPQRSYNERRV